MVTVRPSGVPIARDYRSFFLRTNPSKAATFWNSRAFALGIDDFSAVRGEWNSFFAVSFCDHLENASKFREGRLFRIHQSVAARNRRYFSNPSAVFLPKQGNLVIFQFHVTAMSITLKHAWRYAPFVFCNSSVRAGMISKMSPTTP